MAATNWKRIKPSRPIPERKRARFAAPWRVQTYSVFFSFSSLGRTWAFKESSLYSPETRKRSSRKKRMGKHVPALSISVSALCSSNSEDFRDSIAAREVHRHALAISRSFGVRTEPAPSVVEWASSRRFWEIGNSIEGDAKTHRTAQIATGENREADPLTIENVQRVGESAPRRSNRSRATTASQQSLIAMASPASVPQAISAAQARCARSRDQRFRLRIHNSSNYPLRTRARVHRWAWPRRRTWSRMITARSAHVAFVVIAKNPRGR